MTEGFKMLSKPKCVNIILGGRRVILSGGHRQRVVLAIVLLSSTERVGDR
jgi:hypothetical protein